MLHDIALYKYNIDIDIDIDIDMWRTCVSEQVTKKAQLSIMYWAYELASGDWCEDSGITHFV